jgi:anti-anti-sigma factor
MSLESPSCPVQVHEDGEMTVVQFTGQRLLLDEMTSQAVGEELLALVERRRPRLLLLDFENVAFLSSTTLGVLLVLRKALHAGGGRLVLCHLTPQVSGVFEVTRLDTLFEVRRDGPDSSTEPRN